MISRTVLRRIDNLNLAGESFRIWYSSKPRLAIVGSGPAGMFACNGLLRRTDLSVDVFEYSPVPFGLVRYGVAPDHQEVKNVIHTFDTMFEKNRNRLRLFCNVKIGKDVTFEELTQNYDAVLLAYGSYKTKQLNIPGCNAKNVISGSQFVGWYNGAPNSQAPNLDSKNVVIVGNGNVALDCARVLSSAASGKLRNSDVPGDRLDRLEAMPLTDIKILGRRGPEHVSFTIKELKEQFSVPNWSSCLEISGEDADRLRNSVAKLERKRKRLTEVLIKNIGVSQGERKCRFWFHRVPQEIFSDSEGRVQKLRLFNKESEAIEEIPCDLLIYSIGYETLILDGVPQNEKKMIDMKDYCRVKMDESCRSKVYATGWCAHGPQGVIVDTQQQSIFVAEQIADDFKGVQTSDTPSVDELLSKRHVPFVSWDSWKQIDEQERKRGEQSGKVREKFTAFDRFV